MAPRLQRSMNAPGRRPEHPLRRKPKRNFYAFMLAQLLIGLLAFIFVRDYMSNGTIKQAVANVFEQVASDGGASTEIKADESVAVLVNPPPALDAPAQAPAAPKQETAIFPEPESIPLAEPPAPIVDATAEPAIQAEAQAPPAAVEPKPEPAPVVEAQPVPAAAEPEPAPVVEAQVEPAPAPQVVEQEVAAAAVPDLTPLTDASVAVTQLAAAAGSEQKEGLTFRDCDTCPELVSVGAGQYLVGAGGQGVALPAKSATSQEVVVENPFAIGRYEITFDEWDRCVSAGGCNSQPKDDGWGRGRRPVIHVSYNDIVEQYLPWLSKVTGYTYRLPTEPEWELASQGGNKSSQGQIQEAGSKAQVACTYGNSSDVAAKTSESIWAGVGCNDGFVYTAPVGSLMPNSLGVFDMHGNVWEWVSDCWHGPYDSEAEINSAVCKFHVLRGGSWASEFRFLRDGIWVGDAVAYRSAVRGWETATKARNSIGFRVARSLQ